jgi:hypothetical protein
LGWQSALLSVVHVSLAAHQSVIKHNCMGSPEKQ